MDKSHPNELTRIFISYASEDEECAEIFKSFFECFSSVKIFDASDIRAGRQFFNMIVNALGTYDYIVSLISRDSIINPWVAFEIGAFARGNEKEPSKELDQRVRLLRLEELPFNKYRTPLNYLQIRKVDSSLFNEMVSEFKLVPKNGTNVIQAIEKTINNLKDAINKKLRQNILELKFSESRSDIHETVPTMRHIDVINNHSYRWAIHCRAYMTDVTIDNVRYDDVQIDTVQKRIRWEKLKRCFLKWEHRKDYFIEIPPGEMRTLDAFTYQASEDGTKHMIGRNSSIDVFNQEMHIELLKNEKHQIRIEYKIIDDDFGTSHFRIEIGLTPGDIPHVSYGISNAIA